MSGRLFLLALSFAVACGSSGGGASSQREGSGDAGAHDDAASPAADASAEAGFDASDAARDAATGDADGASPFALALPQVVSGGGASLAQPRIVPILYASDPMAAQIGQFLSALASSSYWGKATGEYGVGGLSIAPTVVLPDPPPGTISDKQIQALVASGIAADGGAWPAPTAGTIYAYFPSDPVTVTMDGSGGATKWATSASSIRRRRSRRRTSASSCSASGRTRRPPRVTIRACPCPRETRTCWAFPISCRPRSTRAST